MKKIRYNSYLCEDLIIEILSRLPVKSLLRFKSVCQGWHVIINNPGFVRDHFHQKSNSTGLLVYRDSCNAFAWFRGETLERYEDLDHRELLGLIQYMQGPCNGIFCVSHVGGDTLVLWNPATRRLRPLPHCPPGLRPWHYGFGIDPITNDLKVVLLDLSFKKPCFAVYSLLDNSWRSFEQESLVDRGAFAQCNPSGTTFSNGFCYWLKRKPSKHLVILAFDLHNHLFQEIEIPEIIPKSGFEIYCYDDDSLALLAHRVTEKRFDVWLMNQHGSWTKISTFTLPFEFANIEVLRRGQVFALTWDLKLMIYNVDSHNTRQLGDLDHIRFSIPYKESLMSL